MKAENGVDRMIDAGTAHSIDIALGRKRKTAPTANDDSDDDDAGTAPPSNDIYRSRQQKKVK